MVGLFRTLNVADLALRAQSVALQTVSHNVANANTEGYHRQRVELSTTLPQDLGFAQVGTGVQVERIRRIVDLALEASVRVSISNQTSLEEQSQALDEIEAIFNEFTEADLSSQLQTFFGAVEDLATNPESAGTRTSLVNEGKILADRISFVAARLNETRSELDQSIRTLVDEANQRLEQIANLNRQIVLAENGGLDLNAANDLRDQRDRLIEEVAGFVEIRVREDAVGAATVSAGGELLVFGGRYFPLTTETRADRNVEITDVRIDGGILLPAKGGRLEGLLEARDGILVEFIDSMDEFARDLIFEFNKIHTEGRGLERFRQITSEAGVVAENFFTVPLATNGTVTTGGSTIQLTDSNLPALGIGDDFFKGLDILVSSGANDGQRRRIVAYDDTNGTLTFDSDFDEEFTAGDTFQITSLPFEIQNGSFEIKAINQSNGTETTFNIDVDEDGLGGPGTDDDLDDIIAAINAGFGAFVGAPLAASRTTDGKLSIDIRSTNFTFAFGTDTSNFLAAIGLNTFFTGSGSLSIGIRAAVEANVNLVAAARSNLAGDGTNALALAQLSEQRVAAGGLRTLDESVNAILSSLGTQAAGARNLLENQNVLTANLLTQRESVSGVNLDEEGTALIKFQRAFQASARVVRVIDELLATLINSL
ncbi:MAG: flagellar hook-associated protein FlgK [Planctomycetes bacterium]|nr:flagellar hook-associated protein FlgK [Planctomycetota bacterium]